MILARWHGVLGARTILSAPFFSKLHNGCSRFVGMHHRKSSIACLNLQSAISVNLHAQDFDGQRLADRLTHGIIGTSAVRLVLQQHLFPP